MSEEVFPIKMNDIRSIVDAMETSLSEKAERWDDLEKTTFSASAE